MKEKRVETKSDVKTKKGATTKKGLMTKMGLQSKKGMKCPAVYGQEMKDLWCSACRSKKRCVGPLGVNTEG